MTWTPKNLYPPAVFFGHFLLVLRIVITHNINWFNARLNASPGEEELLLENLFGVCPIPDPGF